MTLLLVDAANVIGSRPTGWWRDRPGAARSFVDDVREAVRAGRLAEPVTVVLEGAAREGVEEGLSDGVTVTHAPRSGDDALVDVARSSDDPVVLVSADRALLQRARAVGAETARPGWLLDLLAR